MPYKYRIIVLIAEKEVKSGIAKRELREEIAQFIGISYSQFNRLTRAKQSSSEGFSIGMLNHLASYFEVSVEELFNEVMDKAIIEEYYNTTL